MEQPQIDRPTHLHNDDRVMTRYEIDAYRERTFEEGKRSHADRLSDTRLRAVEMAFQVYKSDPQTFGFNDVLRLADHIVAYARDGQTVQDGASDLRFYGRK